MKPIPVDQPHTRCSRWISAVAWCVVLASVAFGSYSLVPPQAATADAPEQAFSANRAMRHIDVIARQPHPMGTAAIEEVRTYLSSEIDKLGLHGVHVTVETVQRNGIAGTHFEVHEHDDAHHHEHHEHEHEQGHEHHEHEHHHEGGGGHVHRGLGDILALIDAAGLPARVADRARRIFTRLGEAEAKVHGIGTDEVHFHEVGAVDSIVDVVAACVALELLGVESVLCSPIAVGTGTVHCAHGELPVPAPATAELLAGAQVAGTEIVGEATTPTGAAVLTTLAESYGPLPPMRVAAVGRGAGTREGGPLPNIVRVFVGEPDEDGQADAVVELSANLDDCTGEVIGAVIEKLLAAGCLDAWAAPIVMKKSRPAWMLSVLCAPADAAEAERLLFAETTTFGVRRRTCSRAKLCRRHETVETPYGPIRVKVGRLDDETVTASPEFEDCRRAAEAHHVAVKEVLAAAKALHRTER